MKNILIVAAREFRQIASMRSFWLTLLIMPLSIAAFAFPGLHLKTLRITYIVLPPVFFRDCNIRLPGAIAANWCENLWPLTKQVLPVTI